MKKIFFDPGDTTGICVFDEDWGIEKLMQLSLDELIQWAANYEEPVDIIGYEKFIVFRQKAMQQTGSKMKVSQAIGVIKMMAARLKVKALIEQAPDIKPIALRWSKIKMPSQHSQSHQWDAFLHGFYFAYKNGRIKSNVTGLAEH